MKPLAFIFTVDCNQQADEKRFDYMALLLLDSIKRFNPEADTYCGVFSNRIPNCKPELLERTNSQNFTYIEDMQFLINKRANAGYLRIYCCHYFTHILDLTEEYENVVFLDLDVILTSSFIPSLHSPKDNVIIYEELDDVIKFYEAKNTDRFIGENSRWFHNWIQILNKSNKHVYCDRSEEFGIHPKHFFSDFFFTNLLVNYQNDGSIILEQQTIGTIPFYAPYNENHFCIHYDNFERRGTFICTKNWLSSIDFMKFKIKGEKYLNQKCKNDPELRYWRNAVDAYKKYKTDDMKDFPQYDGDLI